MAEDINTTLEERGKRYGSFTGLSRVAQHLKSDMRKGRNWEALTPSQTEALEMIATKIARVCNGDANCADTWHDIAGYASLVESQLNGVEK